MSRKKNTTREQVREKNEAIKTERKKKVGKVALYSGIAIVLAVAVALSTIYFIIPLIKGENKSQYEFAYYKSARVPKVFVEILERADAQKKDACGVYGVAIEFNGHSISGPELGMAYYDVFSQKFVDEKTYIATYGSSSSNFPTRELPETVMFKEGVTWEQELLNQAQKEIRRYYYMFDEALKNNFVPTDAQITYIIDGYKSILDSATNTAEDLVKTNYPMGITYDIYAAACIMRSYAFFYSDSLKSEISKKISEKEVDKWLAEKKMDYRVFIGRIAPFEGESDDWKSIKSSQDFSEYILTKYEDEKYDMLSDFSYATYGDISSTFGTKVADFAFSDDRKAGEITKFEANDLEYILLCEKPAHYGNSVDVFVMFKSFDDVPHNSLSGEQERYKALYDRWAKGSQKYDDLYNLRNIFQDTHSRYKYGEVTVRAGEYPLDITQWMFDESRKEGDHKMFMSDEMCFVAYYMGNNPHDSDKDYYGRIGMVEEKFDEMFSDLDDKCPITVHKETAELAPSLVDFSVKDLLGIGRY